jgi:hypothetical protein
MINLRIKKLPSVTPGLLQHDATVFSIGVAAEVRAFVDEALAFGVHHHAEHVAMTV